MGTVPEDHSEDFRLDRTQFSVVRLTDPDDSLERRRHIRFFMNAVGNDN